MSIFMSVRKVFERFQQKPESSHDSKLVTARDELVFQEARKPPVCVRARDVVAIWYDYNFSVGSTRTHCA